VGDGLRDLGASSISAARVGDGWAGSSARAAMYLLFFEAIEATRCIHMLKTAIEAIEATRLPA